MNFFRWLYFWPVAMFGGFFTSGIALLLGDLLFGHCWLTGCLAIVAGTCIHPVAATILAANIAPRVNDFTACSILLIYLPLFVIGLFTIFGLVFLGEEGSLLANNLFSAVSPWWCSFSESLGFILGFSIAWNLWEDFQKSQLLCDQYVEDQFIEATNSPSGGAAESA